MCKIHFIGIGGVGMNGLAQLAAQSGYTVSGSDRAYDPDAHLFRCLESMGISIYPQDGSGISDDTDQIVFSTAIESDNPDIQQAQKYNIPLLHRSAFLKQLVGNDELIAVAGTAGKTTTTGMLGWIFEYMGKDPSVYNGAAVANWKHDSNLGNVRKGHSGLWIIEADESDKSFLNFSPTHSIITNISKDHYELDELNAMFDLFEKQTSGITIRGQSLILSNKHSFSRTDPSTDLALCAMPGKHNQENARCAYSLCLELGLDPQGVKQALAAFKGIERRLERLGTVDGITVFDDYAHNPAKIEASITAIADQFGSVHAYWRPHGFAPLANNLNEFVDMFARVTAQKSCSLYILPVYYAGGTVKRTTDSSTLIKKLNSAGVAAQLMTSYSVLKKTLEESAVSGSAILGMGARDPELPRFAKQLVTEWKTS